MGIAHQAKLIAASTNNGELHFYPLVINFKNYLIQILSRKVHTPRPVRDSILHINLEATHHPLYFLKMTSTFTQEVVMTR